MQEVGNGMVTVQPISNLDGQLCMCYRLLLTDILWFLEYAIADSLLKSLEILVDESLVFDQHPVCSIC